MPTRTVFSIRKLQCAYKPEHPVLRIDALDIPAGSLVFLIGPSGVGKSTFIETLGLMNRTIVQAAETSILFQPSEGESAEFAQAWSMPADALADIRRRHFSFIFQSTNLMPNFSSGENMAMSLLIKGRNFEDAKQEVQDVMKKVHLEKKVFDEPITEVSGGQRQRLAFVRAITADFDVLFGDEPTGNLDAGTAVSLMQTVREKIVQSHGQKTGIIVSHDLPLAIRFADVIIPISPMKHIGANDSEEIIFGQINAADILHGRRTDESQPAEWRDASGTLIPDPKALLDKFVFQSTATATHA